MLQPARGAAHPRVLNVDPDRRVRDSLRDLLNCELGADMVVAVGSTEDALERLADEPDVVVLEPTLAGDGSGADLLAELRDHHPAARLFLMGWRDEMHVAGDAARTADATLDKSASPEDLVAAITQSLSGRTSS
jgi:DNA-binding NarL/FixJ family response regulator